MSLDWNDKSRKNQKMITKLIRKNSLRTITRESPIREFGTPNSWQTIYPMKKKGKNERAKINRHNSH